MRSGMVFDDLRPRQRRRLADRRGFAALGGRAGGLFPRRIGCAARSGQNHPRSLGIARRRWRGDGKIIVLEPRRLAARAAAERMAGLLGESLGENIGLRVRMDTSSIGPKTRIEVVTEGVFARMILDDPSLEGMAAVLFDEFHERSLDADLGLALALDAQAALRPDLRSAGDVGDARRRARRGLMHDAPVIESQGRAFPVETRLPRPRSARADRRRHCSRRCLRALAEENRLDPGVSCPARRKSPALAAQLGEKLRDRQPSISARSTARWTGRRRTGR